MSPAAHVRGGARHSTVEGTGAKKKGAKQQYLEWLEWQANAEKMPVNSSSLFLRRCAAYSSKRLPPDAPSENSSGAASSNDLRPVVAGNAEIAQQSPSRGACECFLDVLNHGPPPAQGGAEAHA